MPSAATEACKRLHDSAQGLGRQVPEALRCLEDFGCGTLAVVPSQRIAGTWQWRPTRRAAPGSAGASGKRLKASVVETNGSALLKAVKGIGGGLYICLKEEHRHRLPGAATMLESGRDPG